MSLIDLSLSPESTGSMQTEITKLNPCKPQNDVSRRAVFGVAAAALASLPVILRASPSTAQAVGSGRISTILDGGFSLPVSSLSRGKPEAEVKAALASAGVNPEKAESVLNVSVLRRDSEVIVFDCGAGQNFVPGTGKFIATLEQQGVQLSDVSHVIFSHGHPDHLWGVLDDFGTAAFPNAAYHFPAIEWDYWFAADIYTRLPEDRHSFAAGAQRILKVLEPQIRRYRGGEELVNGVASIATPGHTPGHMAFEVRTEQGLMIIGGDALTHPVLSFQHPEWAGAFDEDAALASKSRLSLLSKLAAEKTMLIGYHLPNGGAGRVEAKGSAYRFVPL